MSPGLKPRHIARELALLGLSQIKKNSKNLEQNDLDQLLLTAIRTLKGEIQETLEAASAKVLKGEEQLLTSETRTTKVSDAKKNVSQALNLAQQAINRLAVSLELPEFIQVANQQEVQDYTLSLISTVDRQKETIDAQIEAALLDWKLNRLPRIDRDILRIAVAEIVFLDIPYRVAINEAVEIAKRYSDEDGFRFINGVLRRVTDNIKRAERKKADQTIAIRDDM